MASGNRDRRYSRRDDPWSSLDNTGETGSRGKGIAISLLLIVGALLLGGGAGYGFWLRTAPKGAATLDQSPATTPAAGTPGATPKASPAGTGTPHAYAPGDSHLMWVF